MNQDPPRSEIIDETDTGAEDIVIGGLVGIFSGDVPGIIVEHTGDAVEITFPEENGDAAA
ncbi:MAG TPA: hypothetical protein VM124_03500 [Candidatus Limnocylindrales bacterium]|nr:hypothetical protein [Candidatus Limnocylindrales bacterium]